MNNQLQIFKNEKLNFEVKMKLDNGEEVFDVETVARSLGLVSVSAKSGRKYESVRWTRVNEYLKLANTGYEVKKGDFISEPMVYKLAFKANNEVAENFQDWLAVEVIPQIRKTGQYQVDGYINRLCTEIETLKKTINEATDYYKIQPKTVRKYTDYIKKRLKITHANDEFEQVKVMLFARLGIEKWCDIPTNRTDIYDLIEKCMQIVKKERPYEQRSFFD
ncbi:Bro-N domain-containing protein [Clostridium perfringens]|uniref:BRO-N domain-containing protein n=1 Tax=Clostridium perfringens TaxID=1502 RepID=UPI003B029B58